MLTETKIVTKNHDSTPILYYELLRHYYCMDTLHNVTFF